MRERQFTSRTFDLSNLKGDRIVDNREVFDASGSRWF